MNSELDLFIEYLTQEWHTYMENDRLDVDQMVDDFLEHARETNGGIHYMDYWESIYG